MISEKSLKKKGVSYNCYNVVGIEVYSNQIKSSEMHEVKGKDVLVLCLVYKSDLFKRHVSVCQPLETVI